MPDEDQHTTSESHPKRTDRKTMAEGGDSQHIAQNDGKCQLPAASRNQTQTNLNSIDYTHAA